MFFIYLNWFMYKFYCLRLGLNYYASIIYINRSNRSSDIIFSHFLTRGGSVSCIGSGEVLLCMSRETQLCCKNFLL